MSPSSSSSARDRIISDFSSPRKTNQPGFDVLLVEPLRSRGELLRVERQDRCFAARVDHGKDALQFRLVVVDLRNDLIWEIGLLRERNVGKSGLDTTVTVNAELSLRDDHRAEAVQDE